MRKKKKKKYARMEVNVRGNADQDVHPYSPTRYASRVFVQTTDGIFVRKIINPLSYTFSNTFAP